MKTLLIALLLLGCLPVSADTPPPGTVVVMCCWVQTPDGVWTQYCEIIVIKSPAYRDTPVYSAKPDPLLNGMLVRRMVWVGAGYVTYEGIQTTSGRLFEPSCGQ
jgi:hypothetical protein